MDIIEFLRNNRINRRDVIYNMDRPANPRIDLINLLTKFENEIRDELQTTGEQTD